MVYHSVTLDHVFTALSHPVRRNIVQYLATQPSPPAMTAVARDNAISPQMLNKHAIALEKAGIAQRREAGRERHLILNRDALNEAQQWMDQTREYWSQQFNYLEAYIDKINEETK